MSIPSETTYGFETAAAEAFPRYLMYDVNNVCNARCPFCPQSAIAKSESFDPVHIDWDIYRKTIEEASNYPVELVRFTGDGEPLLHPRMMDMIALARDLGLRKINLTTNGSLLSGKRLSALLAAPPHILDVSLDAHTPETYAKYRIGLDFDQTVANIEEFLARRDPKRTKLIVSIIRHPSMDAEIDAFVRHWTGKADEVAVRTLHSNLGAVTVEGGAPPPRRWPCAHLWQRLVVDFRGHIRFCPIDWFDKSYVGEAASMTLAEAWRSPFMASLRARHLRDDYAGCGVCEKCGDWAMTPWGKGWVDMVKKPQLDTAAS